MVQGGQELRQHGSGTGMACSWGSLTTTKPVCRKLQTTNLQLQTTELHDSKDYRNYKLQNSKTADMPTDKLTKISRTAWWPTRGRRTSIGEFNGDDSASKQRLFRGVDGPDEDLNRLQS